jgi:hypothetical protein
MGRTLRMMAEKQPYRQLNRPTPPPESASYRCALPTALKHYVITPDSAREVGEMLEKYFQQQLIMFVKGQIAATGNERQALRSFMKLYDINPSQYDLEHARKVFRDYKDNVLRHNGHFDMLYGPGADDVFNDFADRD